MAEINYDDIGTITVKIGDDTYRLRRPTLGQLQHYTDRISEIARDVQDRITEMVQRLADLEPGDAEVAEIEAEASRMRSRSYEYTTIPWLREVFAKLGDTPLPDDLDEAPSEFANPGLPREFITHWRSVPLARGGRARS